jgi:RNA recognition motif-containing protein
LQEQQNLRTIAEQKRKIIINIYVGNLSYDVTEGDLKQAFSAFGQVESAKIIKDTYDGRSKSFGFVDMAGRAEAHSAIDGLNGKELKGRTVKVNEAQSRPGDRRRGARRGGGRRF